jgi:hypothetical protein
MFEFLSRWLPRAHEHDDNGGGLLPLPVTEKGAQAKWKKHDLKPLDTTRTSTGTNTGISISAPILKSSPQSLTGFDDFRGQWLHPLPIPQPRHITRLQTQLQVNLPMHAQPALAQAQDQGHDPSHSRPGSSNVAWLSANAPVPALEAVADHEIDASEQHSEMPVPLPSLAPPAVIRMSSQTYLHAHARTHAPIPIGRSVSSPSPPNTPSSKWNLRLNTSTHSLRLDSDPNQHPRVFTGSVYYINAGASSTDLFGYTNNYPLVKQLSPIAEQDYFSPESLRRSIPLPSVEHDNGPDNSLITDTEGGIEASPSLSYSHSSSHTNPSPSGSHSSEITRT